MEENSNGTAVSVSVVVDDEHSVPATFLDDTNNVSQSAGNLDPEKRRRSEERDDEDDKNGDRHRRKKKKSKDRERERDHKDKDKEKDGRKREHRDKDKDREKDRSGRDRGDKEREREHDSKRRPKADNELAESEVPRTSKDVVEEGSSSSRSSKPNGTGTGTVDDSTANGRRDRDRVRESDRDRDRDRVRESDRERDRDRDRDGRRSDRGDKEKEKEKGRDPSAKDGAVKETDSEVKDRDVKEKDKESNEKDKDVKEKEKEGEAKKRRSRSRSPARRERDERDRRDRDRSRDRIDRRNRERDRERERERERDRDRERERARQRERDDRNRDRGGYRRRERSNSRSRSAGRQKAEQEKEKKDKEEGVKRITLKDILTANPGISIPDAVQRLNVYNTAAAMGQLDASTAAAALASPAGGSGTDFLLNGGVPLDPSSAAMAAVQAVAALNAQVTSVSGPFGVAGEGGAVTKPHREVYIGNLPPGVTVSQLADFLNAALKQLGVAKEGGSVVSCWVSGDGHYGFAEVRTVDECNAALAYLNGVQIGINLIKVGRPKGYLGQVGMPVAIPGIMPPGGLLGGMMNPVTGMMGMPAPPNPLMVGMGMGGLMGGTLDLHANVVMVSNLPMGITDDQVRELVSPFGTLKAFNSIKTSSGTTSAAVFEYEDTASADGAVSGLDKLDIADHKLSVQRVPPHAAALLLQPSAIPVISPPLKKPPPPAEVKDRLFDLPPTPVIRLSNMTTPKELNSDEEYMELQEDVAEECNVYGTVRCVVIPRGNRDGSEEGEEVGMVYVHFTDSEGASRAKDAIAGRMFNGHIVRATFFPEDLFSAQMYILPDEYVLSGDVAEDSNGNENGHENGNENGNGDGDNYDSYEPELSAMPSELVAPDSMDDGLD